MSGEETWLLDAVLVFLKSEVYTTPVGNFVDEHCVVFGSQDENELQFTAIHQQFVELVFG
jgi:hypothetical protein